MDVRKLANGTMTALYRIARRELEALGRPRTWIFMAVAGGASLLISDAFDRQTASRLLDKGYISVNPAPEGHLKILVGKVASGRRRWAIIQLEGVLGVHRIFEGEISSKDEHEWEARRFASVPDGDYEVVAHETTSGTTGTSRVSIRRQVPMTIVLRFILPPADAWRSVYHYNVRPYPYWDISIHEDPYRFRFL